MEALRFNLLENAIDSLRQGIGFVLKDNPTQSELKLAVLLIAQSIELLLKERLKREHWSLIFTKVEQASNPKANTVTIAEAVKRLECIAKIRLEQHDRNTISNISDIRNQIQHYEISISFEEVIAKAHSVIAFITRFLKDELEKDIRDYVNESDAQKLFYIDEVLNHLREIARQKIIRIQEEYVLKMVAGQENMQSEVIVCNCCWEKFYVFLPNANISQCQLCNYVASTVTCAQCGAKAPKDYWGLHSDEEGKPLCDDCWLDFAEMNIYVDAEYE